jgi:hypothetical protein
VAFQDDASKATVEQLRTLLGEMERMAGQARLMLASLDRQSTAAVDPAVRERTRRAVMAVRAGLKAVPSAKQGNG